MADVVAIAAETRARAGKGAARATRREGKVPGVVYGGKQEPSLISLEPREVLRELQRAGWQSRLYELKADGEAVRACQTAVSSVGTKKITTIEGLSADNSHPVQRAWIAEQVPQCGYCQPGQIMSAAALLARTPHPTEDQIENAMVGNLCRCGMYQRIRKAIHRASQSAGKGA